MRPHAIESRGAKDVEILRKDFLVPAYPAAFIVRVPLSRTRAAWMHFFGNAADDLDNVRVAGAPHLVFLEHPLNLFGRRTENLRTVKIDNVGEYHRKSPPGERKGFPTSVWLYETGRCKPRPNRARERPVPLLQGTLRPSGRLAEAHFICSVARTSIQVT